jgi:g-D-glutamyl-meso-diaminopimelate peptidase
MVMIDFNGPYRLYDNFLSDAEKIAIKYQNILQCVTIGKSHDNRDILMLKLGIGQQYMICCGGVHARETVNPVVLLGMVEYYADLYSNYKLQKSSMKKKLKTPTYHMEAEYGQLLYGTCIYELLQTFTILFVPLLNPDGYMIALNGFEAIQDVNLREKCISMQIPYEDWKYNARGIDINRNFPSKLWKPKSENDEPASESETKALISLFRKYLTKGFLDFHSRGNQIYYYRSIMPDSYNEKQLRIATRLTEITNYELVPPEDEIEVGDTGGNTVHYYSENFSKPALTIETTPETAQFPLSIDYRQPVFEELKMVVSEFGSMII